MKVPQGGFVALRMFCFLLLLAVATLSAPFAKKTARIGIPHDWTEDHLLFNRQALTEHPELARMEPRLLFQVMRQRSQPAPSQDRGDECSRFRRAARLECFSGNGPRNLWHVAGKIWARFHRASVLR